METKTKITFEEIEKFIDERVYLHETDRGDSFDGDMLTIAKCMDERSMASVWASVDDLESQIHYESVSYYISDIKKRMIKAGHDPDAVEEAIEENTCEIQEVLEERDKSDMAMDLLRRTKPIPVRIELISNGDCINSHHFEGGYAYDNESYFTDMVDALNLNPQKVKAAFVKQGIRVFGRWPNKKERDGNEFVSLEAFVEEIENSSSPANLLTFLSRIEIIDLAEVDCVVDEVEIPIGNSVGLYSSACGGGSLMDMELKRCMPVSLVKKEGEYPYFRLVSDVKGDGNGYNSDEVYGCGGVLSGSSLEIIKNN